MQWWKVRYWILDKHRNLNHWLKQRRPITESDKYGMELLFVLYATNLSAVNIKEVSRIKDYYQAKYTGNRLNKYFDFIAMKHSQSDAYRLSNLAWGHIDITRRSNGKSK